MSIVITGVAGFVGTNLAAALISRGARVLGLDNLSRGAVENLAALKDQTGFEFHTVDLADLEASRAVLQRAHAQEAISEVWHMAANSDIPAGIADPRVDLRDTFMTTFNTLVLMRELEIPTLAFASSSAVYGDLGARRLTEDVGPLFPISNYGAMKLASEAAITAALESYLAEAFIFRFPNVIGVPATHGVILDFIGKLRSTPERLRVLGNGTQQKSYLHVDDLIAAMLLIRDRAGEKLNYFNIGAADDGVTVRFIAEAVRDRLAPDAAIEYGDGDRGWVGDVPKFAYSIDKLLALGWHPRLSSVDAVRRALEQIAEQESRR